MVVLEVNADNWEKEILQSDVLTVVDFWHERCPWCVKLAPIFSDIASEYGNKVKFAKLNVLENSENQQTAITYGVMGTPTIIFFCESIPVGTAVGFQTKERLKQLVEDMMIKHDECIQKSTKLKPD